MIKFCNECGNEKSDEEFLWFCWKCGNESLRIEEKLTLGEQNTITEFEKQKDLTAALQQIEEIL